MSKAQAVELKPSETSDLKVGEAIEAWRKHLVSNKELAQTCAILALKHCYQERTASQLRRVLTVIETEGKDFVRRAPFTLWLREYAPVKMVTKTDDQGKKAKVLEFDTESPLLEKQEATITAAATKLWWTMSKDVEQDAFNIIRIDARVLGIFNKAQKQIEAEEEEGHTISANEKAHVRKMRDFFAARVEAAKALEA